MDLISDKRNFYYASKLKEISMICYGNRKSGQDLFILANRDFNAATKIQYSVLLPRRLKKVGLPIHIVYENGGSCNEQREINELKILAPGEVVIGWMKA